MNNTIMIPMGTTLRMYDTLDEGIDRNLTFELASGAVLEYDLQAIDAENALGCQSVSEFVRNITIKLLGEGAQAVVRGRLLGRHSRSVRIITRQHHLAPHTRSSVDLRGVWCDSSRFRSDNLIRIEQGAHESVAHEAAKNLLLSPSARAITIPKLEVETDRVQCQHGAAMSQIDELQLFYLQSRGLTRNDAVASIIEGFLQSASL